MNGIFFSNGGVSTTSNSFPNQKAMNQNLQNSAPNGSNSSTTQLPLLQGWNGLTNHAPVQTVNPMHLQGSQWTGQQQQQKGEQSMAAPMMGFNMQLPAQIIQDALALSNPVSADDDPLLCEHIIQGLQRGDNYKTILNGLHGHNGHSASLWKDYYLEHKERLDKWVNMCLRNMQGIASTSTSNESTIKQSPSSSMLPPLRNERPANSASGVVSIKKPSPFTSMGNGSRASGSSSHKQTATPSVPPSKPRVKERKLTPRDEIVQATGSRRATMNSITVGSPIFDKRLPPPHAEIKIPEPPSRSPTPPPQSSLVLKGRGYKYTDEDDAYFAKFIQWHMMENPHYTKTELCEMIAEKAPHHSAASWMSHWHQIHDLLDKIMASFREGEGDVTTPEPASSSPRKRPLYKDDSSIDDDESGCDSEKEERPAKKRARGKVVQAEDQTVMGPTGSRFTDADRYAMAAYIAEAPDRNGSCEGWRLFAEKHPQRTPAAWNRYYTRKEDELRALATNIKREDQ
ncbi:hypothetical protein BKA70DRAFT_315439 [Coprinopsis sp. MPI-PUGE-AT-0042]|nr:hypothetical protein BKA70DRAFT_315439 [Coprinopsis sp. MPI-PUGE-AT-0042]